MKLGEFIDLRQSNVDVEESMLMRSTRIMKRSKSYEMNQIMFKKRALNQDGVSASKGNLERGGGSRIIKPTFSTYWKKHVGKCLAGTSMVVVKMARR